MFGKRLNRNKEPKDAVVGQVESNMYVNALHRIATEPTAFKPDQVMKMFNCDFRTASNVIFQAMKENKNVKFQPR